MNALEQHLQALENNERYRVDATLKQSDAETTERVFLRIATDNAATNVSSATGAPAEQGPFIRKIISRASGLGASYRRLWDAQRAGIRFVHLPKLISFWQDSESTYVVMEFVPGITLDDWVAGCGAGPAAAAQLFRPICEGVAELHQRFDPPIIHRDIKPSNIMVSAGHVTIIDLGIARTFDEEASQDTKHFGTRAYAPPEQYGFGQTDQRTDVYALGMLLYFLLTGESAHKTGARANGFANPAVSTAMQNVLMRATAFDPAQRFESVEDLFQAFLAAGGENVFSATAATYASAVAATSTSTVEPASTTTPVAASASAATPTSASASASQNHAKHPQKPASTDRFTAVGKIWNGVLLLNLLFWGVVCISITAFPNAPYDSITLPHRALLYATLLFLIFVPISYVLMDRRRLKRRFAWAAKLHGWKLACLTIICVVLAFLIIGIIAPVPA